VSAPTTGEEFVELARKSGVVDEKRLEGYVRQLLAGTGMPEDLGETAGRFVRDGILTHFQAEQLLLGRWRRFTIGRYKVLEQLGSGGMGRVYLCEHRYMRRRVAVKVLPIARAEDPSALERFYREARAVAALDHPNIVRAHDIDEDNGLHFLVMEYIDGASLQDIVKRHGPMDVRRAIHYVRQAALGLQHAHDAASLVHRDIKPGNILIDRQGVVKILDLGLARFFDSEESAISRKFEENVLGTADYLAPEQALDSHSVDIRADIYSLGATFYFCLTGGAPFQEGTVAQKLRWHQSRKPKPVRELRTEVSPAVAAVIETMMAKDRDRRYQVPSDVVEALAPWTTEPIAPPPEKEMPRLSPAAMGSGSWNDVNVHALARNQVESTRKLDQISVSPVRITGSSNLPAFLRASSSSAATPPASASCGKTGNGVKRENSGPETDDVRACVDTLSQSDSQGSQPLRRRLHFVWWALLAILALTAGLLAATWQYWRALISDF
jgi:eukaryotic-like serine/threonine-protein kinase